MAKGGSLRLAGQCLLLMSTPARSQALPIDFLAPQQRARWLSQTPAMCTVPTTPERPRHFSYDIAASYIGKDRPYDPATHIFQFNPHHRMQAPKDRSHKASRPESGQDAFFVSRVGANGSHNSSVALGVADGVGGWADQGVDPADFSHGLCEYMAAAAHEHAADEKVSPRRLMQAGYDAVNADPTIKAGGSTAVVGVLSSTGSLEVANLGDSGFLHLRLNAVQSASEPQIHAFNTPYQLSIIPPSLQRRASLFGSHQLSDLPKDAEVSRHRLQHGDVLILASDGLWDNVFNQDLLRIVSQAMTRTGAWIDGDSGTRAAKDLSLLTSQQQEGATGGVRGVKKGTVTLQALLATEIVGAAKAASVNAKLDGPFAKEVKKYFPQENWHGGKIDDICVVVVVVSEMKEAAIKSKL
jgi:protein phosphatase PTC7